MRLPRFIALLWLCLSNVALGQALNWEDHGSHRLAKLTIKPSGKDGFRSIAANQTGVKFANRLSRLLVAKNRNLANGSGVAIGDVDGDGLPDIYFCGLQTDNKLYRNLGDWSFEDATDFSGVACPRQYSTGALIEDVDGDGDNDLLVTGLAKGTRLFLNNGMGQFTEKTNSGLFPKLGATSMAMADYDLDGDMDLYVANYRTTTHKDRPPGVEVSVTQENGKIIVSPSSRFTYIKSSRRGGVNIVELGEQDFLYENIGDGRFTPVSWTKGTFLDANGNRLTKPPQDWGLSVAMRDFNGDLLPDIYVCNDFFFSVDKFWLNQGNGTFKLVDHQTIRNFSMSSMSVDCADINLDGFIDFFVADMLSRKMSFRQTQRANVLSPDIQLPISDAMYQPEFPRNTLQLGRGNGVFVEIAQLAGLHASEWTWSSRFLDIDLDGYQDLILTTGNEADVLDADMLQIVSKSPKTRESHVNIMMKYPKLETPNLIFKNNGDLTFSDESEKYGFGQNGISHGMAAGDLDNDGDLDLVINNLNEPASIFENIGDENRIAVRLMGKEQNTHAVGALIELTSTFGKQSRQVISGGRYLSGGQPQCVFAVPNEDAKVSLTIRWPNNRITRVEGIPTNTMVEISQKESEFVSNEPVFRPAPMFSEAAVPSTFIHEENPFDDFEVRPLSPIKGSTIGPGLCAADLDGDYLDEILMGTGKGGVMRGIKTSSSQVGTYEPIQWTGSRKNIRDVHSFVVQSKPDGNWRSLISQSNYEDGLSIGSSLYQYESSAWENQEQAGVFGPGPMAMADVDADGDLDLFVGGTANHADSYITVSSFLLLDTDGELKLNPDESVFKNIGSVTGAVFSDVDNDGDSDLLLARRWNSPLLYINNGGKFNNQSDRWGLGDYHGYWNGVAAGDFNADGLMDFVMTNLGQNNRYHPHLKEEIRLHVLDFNGDGIYEGVESIVDKYLAKRVPMRDMDTLAKVMPWIRDMFPSYHAFGQASVDLLFEPLETLPVVLKLNTLETSLFINKGNAFVRSALPIESQFAPALGCSVADFDGDGHEDIYLGQNFFDVESESTRHDAGRGQILLGDGNGQFRVLSHLESGVSVLGQARSTVVSDLNGDGRVDIVTGQNNGQAKIYYNKTGKQGARIFLRGHYLNPAAIGASLTLLAGNKRGPKRELRLGTGYLSQDGLGQLIVGDDAGFTLEVRWPGAAVSRYAIPKDAKLVSISEDNGVHVVQ